MYQIVNSGICFSVKLVGFYDVKFDQMCGLEVCCRRLPRLKFDKIFVLRGNVF